jgi:hypothetical protein
VTKVGARPTRPVLTADLMTKVGTRELQLSHDAFDALPPSRSL